MGRRPRLPGREGGGLLRIPLVLHRQAQNRRHRRPRREVQAPLHQEAQVTPGAMPPRITLPPSRAALAVIAAVFILPGLAGHDLWKTQDAIGLGIVHGMALSGDLVVPRIAGERWLYDEPLYHWVALAFGKLLGPFIEFHAAALVAVLVALTWPLALAARAPDAFAEWRAIVTEREGTAGENLRHFFATASWFTWPAWPLALWSAWSLRKRWREARLFVPAVAVLVMSVLLIAWGPPADENLLPLLAPLSLFAAHGIFTLRRGAAAALDWFGALTFGVFAAGVWLGYIAMLTGLPGPVARNFARIAPGFVMHAHLLAILSAFLLAAAWVYLVFYSAPSPLRSLARWAGGMVLLWGTFSALWMPWVDYQKSYRSVALQLKSKLPVGAPCLAERNLGVSQAAALDS